MLSKNKKPDFKQNNRYNLKDTQNFQAQHKHIVIKHTQERTGRIVSKIYTVVSAI